MKADKLSGISVTRICNTHAKLWSGSYKQKPFWMWSSSQSFWLHIQRSGLDSRGYQILWELVGLKRAPLSLVSTTEGLLEIKCITWLRKQGFVTLTTWHRLSARVGTNFADKPRSLGIVHSRTPAKEFSFSSKENYNNKTELTEKGF
jgi:hypothetical protein